MTSLAAPNAASSSVARYSFVARLAVCGAIAPLRSADRPLLIGVCHNQARIRRKALAPDQAGPNTGSDNAFEYAPENAAVQKRSLRARENTE